MEEDSAHIPTRDIRCAVFRWASVTDGLGPTFCDRRPQHGKDCTTYRERWSQTPPLKQFCKCVNFAQGVSISVNYAHGVSFRLNWFKCQGHMTFHKCQGHDLLLITWNMTLVLVPPVRSDWLFVCVLIITAIPIPDWSRGTALRVSLFNG